MNYMKKSTIISLALLLAACASWPEYDGYVGQEHLIPCNDVVRLYDKNGDFVGHINERSKRLYDRNGNYIGLIQR